MSYLRCGEINHAAAAFGGQSQITQWRFLLKCLVGDSLHPPQRTDLFRGSTFQGGTLGKEMKYKPQA